MAERLVQVRGFNGFSYADVAAELKITKAALHYHFVGKAELGEALVARYATRFAEALAARGGAHAPKRLPGSMPMPISTSMCCASTGCACAE